TGGLRPLGPAEAAAGLARQLHRPPQDQDLPRIVSAMTHAKAIALAGEGVEPAVDAILASLPCEPAEAPERPIGTASGAGGGKPRPYKEVVVSRPDGSLPVDSNAPAEGRRECDL
ncbi:MAG: hypothetical protein JKY65_21915, partial [Planctomycetes bacterium]|nr:hypothetical protein [Planctomycetota bacterium]